MAKSVSGWICWSLPKKDRDYLYSELNKRISDISTVLGSPDSTEDSEKEWVCMVYWNLFR